MPNNNSYITPDEARRYYDRIELLDGGEMIVPGLYRPHDVTYCTTDPWELEEARKALHGCRATTLGGTYGFVVAVKHVEIPPMTPTPVVGAWQITIKPTGRQNTLNSKQIEQLLHNNWSITAETIRELKEDNMKVYEGIIVKLDEQGQAAEVLKVVTPFVAKDAQQATDTIRTDYAIENKLSGKDAAALRVRVREFPVA